MDKNSIAAFFDGLAPHWDERQIIDEKKMNAILDAAEVKEGMTVLDVACGTGVMFPYYISRNVAGVTGVDISAEMIKMAGAKVTDGRIKLVCGDIEALAPTQRFDRCVIYNAFPHFSEPKALISKLTAWLKPEGKLTVAHGMSLERLKMMHEGKANRFSREMLSAPELKKLMEDSFYVDTAISDEQKYIVSGRLK